MSWGRYLWGVGMLFVAVGVVFDALGGRWTWFLEDSTLFLLVGGCGWWCWGR